MPLASTPHDRGGVLTLVDSEAVTQLGAKCGYLVHHVGLTWVHPYMKTTCPRSNWVEPVRVARATVWLETVTGEPC